MLVQRQICADVSANRIIGGRSLPCQERLREVIGFGRAVTSLLHLAHVIVTRLILLKSRENVEAAKQGSLAAVGKSLVPSSAHA